MTYLYPPSFAGLGLGPLLNMAVQVNPSIVSTALMSTTLIFACFRLDITIKIKIPLIITPIFYCQLWSFEIISSSTAYSLAALFAPDGHYLYLGGTLLSGLSMLFWLGLLNIFFRCRERDTVHPACQFFLSFWVYLGQSFVRPIQLQYGQFSVYKNVSLYYKWDELQYSAQQ